MLNTFYPRSPVNVPADFTVPGKAYKKHIWIASLAFLLFMALYLGLTGWFLLKAWGLLANTFSGGRQAGLTFFSGFLLGFLGLFMIKALFYLTKRDKSADIEIKAEDEPELFAFIHKVADDAKAPRPHRVFVSNMVNASVFYDISIINLFFPTRKNLVIGLGLVNTLNLGEFKAILAHEFGHFTQKSMIIGRWVYIVHKVAYQIVARRDWLDNFLRGLSSIDIRIAWIGWILSIFVWSIRSISETFFKLVLLTQRALSREMEFHADLVSVSLSGSDALVNALHKLTAADEAYDEAIDFANRQLKKNKALPDMYAIQSNYIRHMAVVLNNPEYGATPAPPDGNGAAFRVFKDQIAQAPKMWNTHPSNIDREKNAKAVYIRAEADERSSWLLFKDADALKNRITQTLYTDVKVETTMLTVAESIELHDQEFGRSFLLPKYRGVFLHRFTMVPFKTVDELHDRYISLSEITTLLPTLYPESVQDKLEHWRNLQLEVAMLEGLNKKELDPNEGKIHYRNREIRRRELPAVIEEARNEMRAAENELIAHDKLCRNVYFAASKHAGNGWDNYLDSVSKLVHFCEHVQKNIQDISAHFYETLHVTSKIRNVSFSELYPLVNAAAQLNTALSDVFNNGKDTRLSEPMVRRLDGKQFYELLQPFEFGTPDQASINMWIEIFPSWINLALEVLRTLREAALDEMLQTEAYVAAHYTTGAPVPAPESNRAPGYQKNDPTLKREVTIQPDLLSRFYNADGVFTTIGRLAAASVIILLAVFLTANIGQNNIYIYNGLPVNVVVHIAGKTVDVMPGNASDILIDEVGETTVRTETATGELIETFNAPLPDYSGTCVYNVAGAAILYEAVIYYGDENYISSKPPKYTVLGPKRWSETAADYLFTEPPSSITLPKGSSFDTKILITNYTGTVAQQAAVIEDENERHEFITTHCRWEKSDSPDLVMWLNVAMEVKNLPAILEKRLAANPAEVASLRMQQEYFKGAEKQKIAAQHKKLYEKNPENSDLYYIYVRSWEDSPAQDSAFIAGHEKWKDNPWLAYASAFCYVNRDDWENALKCYKVVDNNSRALRSQSLDDMKRVCQLLHDSALMEAIPVDNIPYIGMVEAIENSTPSGEPALYAYKLLREGQLQDALNSSISDSSIHYSILMLAAVSDGAGSDMIEEALRMASPENLSRETIAPELVLAVRNNKPLEPYMQILRKSNYVDTDSLLRFIEYVKAGKISNADRILNSFDCELKGKMCLAGVLLLGKNAPEKWHTYAAGLLFINEKPYRKDERTKWNVKQLR